MNKFSNVRNEIIDGRKREDKGGSQSERRVVLQITLALHNKAPKPHSEAPKAHDWYREGHIYHATVLEELALSVLL